SASRAPAACACPAGQTACGSACVNIRADDNNCGACGTVCSGGESCMSGACACPAGQCSCGGACVNVRTDNNNCGACGNACGAGQSCSNGVCACPPGQTLCSGACVNLLNDNANCGRCAGACTGGSSCNAGACTFAPPANDRRAAAVDINMTAASSTFTVNTTMATNDTAGPAGCACTNGRDVFYRFVLRATELVYADTVGSAFNTSLFFQTSAGANITAAGVTGGAACNDDGGLGCATGQQSQVLVQLAAGTYYLVVSGCNQGAATVHFQHLPVGGTTFALSRTVGVTQTYTGTLTGANQLTTSCNGRGPERTGWLVTCPSFAGGAMNLTTCGDQRTDTVLEQRSAARTVVSACNDDSCNLQSRLATTVPSGAGLHTVYVDSFNPTLPAGQGGYTLRYTLGACATGATLCANTCVNTQTDAANCGACGTVCSGGATCTAGRCGCPAGQSYCGGTCVATTADVNNCGACGTRCGFGQLCASSRCVNGVTGPSFQVTALTTTACASIDATSVVSDTTGGIAVSATNVFDGGSFTGRFSATNLSGGARVGTNYDGLLSNLRTGEVYALGTASGFLTRTTGAQTITRLVRLNPATGAATTTVIPLSTTIPVNTSSNIGGVYSGYDRAVVVNGTNAFHIELPTGVTRDLGIQGIPDLRRACTGTWANWGVVEQIGGVLYLDFVRTDNRIARVRVGATAGSVIGTQAFTNLGDACSFTVSPILNRWYLASDAVTQFRAGAGETLVVCNATTARPSDTFRIGALAATGCNTSEIGPVVGEDFGGVALSTTGVFYNGTTTALRASVGDLGNAAAVTPARRYDALVSDLRFGRVFALGNGATPITAGGSPVVNSLVEVDGNTGALTGRTIALSQSITLAAGAGIFSGWEAVGLWTGGRAYEIALPTGTVRDLGAVSVSGFGCDSGYFYGVMELVGGVTYFVNRTATASTQRITRTTVPSGAVATVATFTNLGDMCSVNFSTARNRWYFHVETANQFRTLAAAETQDETLGYCSGSYTRP
ncbi:MAG: MXAN_6577-like cysteine-rich protein, partial [Polyangiales bacterium]